MPFSTTFILSAAALSCFSSLASATNSSSPCRISFHACNSVGAANVNQAKAYDCSIGRFHQLLSLTAKSLVVSEVSMRLQADVLKQHWKNKGGFCYIEAIVGAKGRILYLRYDETRSLLTGSAGTKSWDKLQNLIHAYEARPSGMQLLMDLNGKQRCSSMNEDSSSRGKSYIFARLMNRSEVNVLPTANSYINMDFTASASEIKQVQPIVFTNILGWRTVDVASIMLDTQFHPLTVWIYKCPMHLGFSGLPCNSEVNAYIFLRSWINASRWDTHEEDFNKNYAGWRYKFLANDLYLVSLMVAIPLYIAIHLHCIMWFGLSPVTSDL